MVRLSPGEFINQVRAEARKVIWPTRKELITYTWVVLVFVTMIAIIVAAARTGRVVAMASQPTYDPDVWTGGISKKQLAHLYSEKAGTPLLSRATQGQFAPGSISAASSARRCS